MDLNDLAVAVAKCREGWKSQSGRYPDRIWDMALALISKHGVEIKAVSVVMKVQLRTVHQRVQKQVKKGNPAKPRPQFIELHGRGLENSLSGSEPKPESSVTPHLVMHCKNGAELRAHLPSEPSVVQQSLMQRLVSCWVSAHR